MATKLPIFASRHFDFDENLKTTYSKELFNEIWLIIGDYQYIWRLRYWNKNWKFLLLLDFSKAIFPDYPQMLIYAIFFPVKEAPGIKKRIHERDNYKKYRTKIDAIMVVKYAKNSCRIPWSPRSIKC